jgi:hypothetical protein
MKHAVPAPPGSDIRAELDRLLRTDPAVADRDEIAELVSTATRMRSWLDAYEVRCARRTCELSDAGRSEPVGSMFARAGQRSGKDAAKVDDRHSVCDDFDSFEDALVDGRISAGHLDGVAEAIRDLDDAARSEFVAAAPKLLDAAVNESVDTFSRHCRELSRHLVASHATSDAEELDRQRARSSIRRWVDKVTGMCHTHAELDPIRDAALSSAIDAQLARLRREDGNSGTPWNQLKVDAFVAAVTTGATRRTAGVTAANVDPADSRADGADDDAAHGLRVPEITILTDLATLVEGLHEHSVCETEDGIPVPVSTVRRLCCDAEIIPVVLGTDGVPLDMGRSIRTANRHQRRALRTMYRTCAHPDCTVAFSRCTAHHVRWWWKHTGPTDIENMIPLCDRHHHLVHEGGWTLTMTPDRVTTWTRPDGIIAHQGRSTDRTPDGFGTRPPRRSSG